MICLRRSISLNRTKGVRTRSFASTVPLVESREHRISASPPIRTRSTQAHTANEQLPREKQSTAWLAVDSLRARMRSARESGEVDRWGRAAETLSRTTNAPARFPFIHGQLCKRFFFVRPPLSADGRRLNGKETDTELCLNFGCGAKSACD